MTREGIRGVLYAKGVWQMSLQKYACEVHENNRRVGD